MPSDLYAERLRVVSGSQAWTIGAMTGTNPNGAVSEPSGSLLRSRDGGLWINTNGGTEWLRLGAGVLTGSYTAVGTEGSTATVTLPSSFDSSNYKVFVTNVSGSTVSAYQIPESLRTTSNFRITSTAPFAAGDKFDYLAVSGVLYAGGGGSAGGGGGDVTPSVSIALGQNQSAGDISLSGTIDWIHLVGLTSANPSTVVSTYSKRTGGWLKQSFNWTVYPGSFWSGGGGSATVTSTALDTIYNLALSTTTIQGPQNATGLPGMGYSFRVPASSSLREVRFYSGYGSQVGGGNVTITCTLPGFTTSSIDTGGGGETRISFKGTGEMNVSVTQGGTLSGVTTCWVAYVLLRDYP